MDWLVLSKSFGDKKGILQESFTISGNGKQVRDVLHGQDVVNLYFKSKDVEAAYGQAFNIGGGVENSLSLLELFEILEQKLDIKMNYREIDWRESDQKVFIADIKKAVDIIDWTPEVSKEVGLDRMLNWLQK